jgi:hypothetical protein
VRTAPVTGVVVFPLQRSTRPDAATPNDPIGPRVTDPSALEGPRKKVAERRNRNDYGTIWDRYVGRSGCNIVETKRNVCRPLLLLLEDQRR